MAFFMQKQSIHMKYQITTADGVIVATTRTKAEGLSQLRTIIKEAKKNGGKYLNYYSLVPCKSIKRNLTNEQAIKMLFKSLSNTPHMIGLAILRERLLTSSKLSQKHMAEHPESWENPFITIGMYNDFFNRINDILKFD